MRWVSMKYKIHYTTNGYPDYFILDEMDIDSIRKESTKVAKSKGLDPIKNDMWSEEI